MQYTMTYRSPLGHILIAADERGLTGLWFEGAKYYGNGLTPDHRPGETKALCQAKEWLEIYFSGQNPGFMPHIYLTGTPFRLEVWKILQQIPYGQTMTYGQIARQIGEARGLPSMSAQAVGGAVGNNPVSIVVPCHRVVGSDGSPTGYAGGIEKKIRLLRLEGVDLSWRP